MSEYRVIEGDCIEAMTAMPEASVDAIVTDPPYGLGFMGREWDSLPPGLPWARECLRVLKPGGHLLAFGGTRTYHRLTCAIEDAGFEIRDCLAWLYGSGFPKSLDVSKAIDKAAGAEPIVIGHRNADLNWRGKESPDSPRYEGTKANDSDASNQGHVPAFSRVRPVTRGATPDAERWQGWGTALKPAHEPIVIARKPLVGTVAGNVLEHGTGALNVDGCRITAAEALVRPPVQRFDNTAYGAGLGAGTQDEPTGRWPANVLLDEEAAALLDGQTGECRSAGEYVKGAREQGTKAGAASIPIDGLTSATYADSGGASRFFYVAKASSGERNAGLDEFATQRVNRYSAKAQGPLPQQTPTNGVVERNHHPTVKPIDLMRWLCRLVTPPGGLILDPFAGSGSTGCAAVLEDFNFVGIEREAEYVAIAKARIAHWWKQPVQLGLEAA